MKVYKQTITTNYDDMIVTGYLYAVLHRKSWNATIWFGERDFIEIGERDRNDISLLTDAEFFELVCSVAKAEHEMEISGKAEPVAWSPYIDQEEARVSSNRAPLGSIPNHGLLTYQQCHNYLIQMSRNCLPLLQGLAGLTIQQKETMPLAVEMIEKAEKSLSAAWYSLKNAVAFSHFAGQQAENENPNHTARTLEPFEEPHDSDVVRPDVYEFGSEEPPAFSLPGKEWNKHGFSRFRINEADKAQGLLTVHVAVSDSSYGKHTVAIYDRKPLPATAPEMTWTPQQWSDHLIEVAPAIVKAFFKSLPKTGYENHDFDDLQLETVH